MDHVRASSLESNKPALERYGMCPSTINQSNMGRNRLQSLIHNPQDASDDSVSMDYYFNRDCQRPVLSNSELKSQLDLLQCTVNKMLNIDAFELGSSCPSANISEALKHEYRQMMSALKDLENILSIKRNNIDVNFSNSTSSNDIQIHQLQREIYYRDSLIKCLSDRLKVLCKANDKLIIDYENQENILSEELLSLKRQLENAKDAIRSLSILKKRPGVSGSQDVDNELYYMRESLCTKDMMVADLKHRVERLNRENTDLKCELDNKGASVSRGISSQFERELCYLQHVNEQMKSQIDNLNNSLDMKNHLINDLQNRLECNDDTDIIRDLREQCLIMSDENDLHKEQILEQMEMLEDFRNQLDVLSENTQFKDDTITDLKSCLRKLTNSIAGVSVRSERGSQSVQVSEPRLSNISEGRNTILGMLLNSVKNHLNQKHPSLLSLIGSESEPFKTLEELFIELLNLLNQQSNPNNVIELFKEFLTNDINLKSTIGHYLANNVLDNVDAIKKLQNHLSHLLSIDMDGGFNEDLKDYLHQCYLLDDNLRMVVEYLVKYINNIPMKSIQSVSSDKKSTMTIVPQIVEPVFQEPLNVGDEKVKSMHELEKMMVSQKDLLEEKSKLSLENERLKENNELLASKLNEMEKNLKKRTSELDNLEKSMRKLSNKFVDLSTSNDSIKSNIEAMKDAQIEKLSKELQSLTSIKKSYEDLEKLYNEKTERLSSESIIQQEKSNEIRLLNSKLSEERRLSKEIKSTYNDSNQHLELKNKQLNEENVLLSEKLLNCIEDKSKLELKLNEIKYKMVDQENAISAQLQSDNYSLKLEKKSLEMKSHSIESEKSILEAQVRQLKDQLDELAKGCADNHVDKRLFKRESDEASECKQKMVDMEGILAVMTEELNEKVISLEEIRRMIKTQPLIDLNTDSKCDKSEKSHIQELLISHKDSEISYLKSKLESSDLRKSHNKTHSRSPSIENILLTNNEISRLTQTILELEKTVKELSKQLTDKSDTITSLQHQMKEKESIIENASRLIKSKNDSLIETEKLMHMVSLQNTNIKDELSTSYNDNMELKMLKTLEDNLKDENQRLHRENDNLRESYRKSLSVEPPKKFKSQSFDILPQKASQVAIRDNSIEQINQEIKKLSVNFEDKNNELRELSLKEIKSRDMQLDNVNLELKLKTDQIQKILIENRRLSDLVEDESQRSSKYERNLMLKEQLLQKLLKEKEKIRATFITELSSKSQELQEKSKTVYFLNAELHRLSSDLEILNAELNTVKTSEKFNVTQTRTLEITEAELNQIKEENTSLKFCINLKMAETEAMRNELTFTQIGNEKLSGEINCLKTDIIDKENQLRNTYDDNRNTKKMLSSVESETQQTIDKLQAQLNQIKNDYEDMREIKMKLEKAVYDLSEENISLKCIKETLENEKRNYTEEIEKLHNKIHSLSQDLSDTKEIISRVSGKIEKEKEKGRRLSDVVEMSEKSQMMKSTELDVALRQLDKISDENSEYRIEINRLRSMILTFENQDCINNENHQRIKALEKENIEIVQKLQKNNNLENQLEQSQVNLDEATNQLFIMEEKWTNCNNDWLEKYGLLRDSYEKLEFEFIQLEHQFEMVKEDNITKCQELICLNNKIQQLIQDYKALEQENVDVEKVECENKSLQNYNREMSLQIETLTTDLVSAHTQIWNATSKINEHQTTIGKLCSRLNHKLTSERRYGSQPLLNNLDMSSSDMDVLHQRDYNDLKNRYEALCNQIDNMISQLKKKDKRIGDLENENEINTFNSVNYEQMKCDYHALDVKYQRLKSEFFEITQKHRCYNQEHFNIHDREVQVIQACTNELQETIHTQNQELDHLKSSHEMLANDYHGCCQRLQQLEKQVELANLELGNWQNTYYDKAENISHLEEEVTNLRHQNKMLSVENDETNRLKQEIMDVSGRMVEMMNCNTNLEQQSINYRQKIMNQNQIIDDLQAQLNNLETYYECEVDKCRKDILVLKGNDRAYSAEVTDELGEKNNMIHCLNNELQCANNELQCAKHELQCATNELQCATNELQCTKHELQCATNELQCAKNELQCAKNEISTFNDQYSLQCEQYEQLKQDLDNQLMGKNELHQEYQDQCHTIEQLSAQLFDTRELLERLTTENHKMASVIDERQSKMGMLIEKLSEKDNDFRESQKNVVKLEKQLTDSEQERRDLCNRVEEFSEEMTRTTPDTLPSTNELRNELTSCYDIIDNMKRELTTLKNDNERMVIDLYDKDRFLMEKEQQLEAYNNGLEISNEEVQKLKREMDHRNDICVKELKELKIENKKLSHDLSYLQQKKHSPHKPAESQTNEPMDLLSPSPFSDYRGKTDQSMISEATYSSSKSVTWKTTHTEKRSHSEDEVVALQQAIDDYNTLITDLTVPDNLEATSMGTHSSLQGRMTPQYTAINDGHKVTHSDVAEVIFVEVDEQAVHNISIQSNIEVQHVYDAESPKLLDIIELLRNCNINIDYDESRETPEAYFGRVMNKYKELEQFFVASMKIQIKHPIDDETVDIDNFTENLQHRRSVLNEHCKQLNSMLQLNTVELNDDMDVSTAKKLSQEDIKKLIDVITTQQMQSTALSIGYNNIRETMPIDDNKGTESEFSLASPYQMILKSKDSCGPNIQPVAKNVSQLSIGKKPIKTKTVEMHSVESSVVNIQEDSFKKKLSTDKGVVEDVSKKTYSIQDVKKSHKLTKSTSSEVYVPESNKTDVYEANVGNVVQKDSYRGTIKVINNKDISDKEMFQIQAMLIKERCIKDDSYKNTSFDKDIIGDALKVSMSMERLNTNEPLQPKPQVQFQLPQTGKQETNEESTQKIYRQETIEDISESTFQEKKSFDVVVTVDNIQYRDNVTNVIKKVESKEVKTTVTNIGTKGSPVNVKDKAESVKINVAMEMDMNEINDTVEIESVLNNTQHSMSMLVRDMKDRQKSDHIHLQNISEGLSISEGKTKEIEQFEDNLSYASVGHFEKAMHQLNDINFDNLDPTMTHKDRIRIYAAEIDYLNEKNLFHTYAINVLTDPERFSYNSSFVTRVGESLNVKAKHLNLMQAEHNFDPHLSVNEKALISKVLESDYTYKQQFDEWMELQRRTVNIKPNNDNVEDLMEELDKCRSKNIRDIATMTKLQKEIDHLKEELLKGHEFVNESELLKNPSKGREDQGQIKGREDRSQIKGREDRSQNKGREDQDPIKIGEDYSDIKRCEGQGQTLDNQESIPNSGRQSKIPLLKGSTIDGPAINLGKSVATTPSSSRDHTVHSRSDNTGMMLNKQDQLVSPKEVKMAIAGETSLENLKRFANLLAEDNFDLASEIEKLLTTIEELRRQLKENCEILSETVDMLQNSEVFVNDLERKLSMETKKTQIISNRVDQLNEVNKQVVAELQRMLKENSPRMDSDMDVQERCNYLLLCLNKLESHNKGLEDANYALQKQLDLSKSNCGLSFLSPDFGGTIDFEFETTLLPNGTIIGNINLVRSDDPTKTMTLVFEVHSTKADTSISVINESSRVSRFLIEREAQSSSITNQQSLNKSENDIVSRFKKDNNNKDNFNNNCCLKTHRFSTSFNKLSSHSTSLVTINPHQRDRLSEGEMTGLGRYRYHSLQSLEHC